MPDPKTLPELFVRVPEHSYEQDYSVAASAEAVALEAFEEILFGSGEPPNLHLVITTHARDATDECRALLARIREVNGQLFDFGFEYGASETLAQNEARLQSLIDTNHPPRKPTQFNIPKPRGFH